MNKPHIVVVCLLCPHRAGGCLGGWGLHHRLPPASHWLFHPALTLPSFSLSTLLPGILIHPPSLSSFSSPPISGFIFRPSLLTRPFPGSSCLGPAGRILACRLWVCPPAQPRRPLRCVNARLHLVCRPLLTSLPNGCGDRWFAVSHASASAEPAGIRNRPAIRRRKAGCAASLARISCGFMIFHFL